MPAFSALRLHPFLVAALYRDREWRFARGDYACPLVPTAVVASTPASLRRAVVLVLCCGAGELNTTVWRPAPGMGWFVPAFFLRLLVGHAAGSAPEGD